MKGSAEDRNFERSARKTALSGPTLGANPAPETTLIAVAPAPIRGTKGVIMVTILATSCNILQENKERLNKPDFTYIAQITIFYS